MGIRPEFLLGARSAQDVLQLDEFTGVGKVYVSTEERIARRDRSYNNQ